MKNDTMGRALTTSLALELEYRQPSPQERGIGFEPSMSSGSGNGPLLMNLPSLPIRFGHRRHTEERMSRGIIQTAQMENKVLIQVDARGLSQPRLEGVSEEPTLADLVLPGSGHKFSDEFACLLNVLSSGGESL